MSVEELSEYLESALKTLKPKSPSYNIIKNVYKMVKDIKTEEVQ